MASCLYKYTPSDMYNMAIYGAGLYRKLTGIPCILIRDRSDLQPGDTFTLEEDDFVEEFEPECRVVFNPPKKAIRENLEGVMFEHLREFINQKCALAKRYRITASNLHKAFEAEVGEPVSHNRLFPKIMEEVMRLKPTISKRITGGKTVYHGIRLVHAPVQKVRSPVSSDDDNEEESEEGKEEAVTIPLP